MRIEKINISGSDYVYLTIKIHDIDIDMQYLLSVIKVTIKNQTGVFDTIVINHDVLYTTKTLFELKIFYV